MSKLKKTTYELRDIAVMQAPISYCNHRSDVNPFVSICNRECYPIFVAPMASVTDENNYKTWIENKLCPVVPRSVGQRLSFDERMNIAKETFVSISLNEAQNDFMTWASDENNFSPSKEKLYICIDIAHGTLSGLYDICKSIKKAFADSVELMTGNIANPNAYQFYADAGISYVRCGIGGGSRCLTSANVSVHFGLATLIDELNEQRKAYAHSHNGYAPTKLIADGGIGWFDDIQKAIALGADAVMCGNLLARSEEACGEIGYAINEDFFKRGIYYTKKEYEDLCKSKMINGYNGFRNYYGMSTKLAQTQTGGDGNKTSEGISRPVMVEYPISKWVDNMQSYLRSAMTYTNSKTIKEMQENAQVVILGGSGDSAYRK